MKNSIINHVHRENTTHSAYRRLARAALCATALSLAGGCALRQSYPETQIRGYINGQPFAINAPKDTTLAGFDAVAETNGAIHVHIDSLQCTLNPTMRNFYGNLMHEQNRLDIEENQEAAAEMERTTVNIYNKYIPKPYAHHFQAAAKYLSELAFDLSFKAQKNHKKIAAVAKLMNIYHDVRSGDLAEYKFMLDVFDRQTGASKVSLKDAKEIKTIATDDKIPYKEKIRLVRIKLFGAAPD